MELDPEAVRSLTDDELSKYQKDLMNEMNRRLRVTALPGQIRDVIVDARRGGELSDDKIREAFEAAMSEDVTTDGS